VQPASDDRIGPAVQMSGMQKSFGGVHALKGVDFAVHRGEVHALVGENGAGKSTLLKILVGVHTPDEGTVRVLDENVEVFTPAEARRHGVAMIFQEMSLIPTLSVAQNVFLGREVRGTGGMIDDRATKARTRELLEELGVHIDPTARVSHLSTGQQQLTEIAKALSQDAKVLILDEPTTALSTADTELLFTIIRTLTARGVAIVYVSHRMNEITRIADRVTVLRDGEHIVTDDVAALGMDGIINNMIGEGVTAFAWQEHDVDRTVAPLLEVRSLSVHPLPADVSFALYPGEVMGLAGLMGSGRSSLARALCGLQPIVSGEVLIRGEPRTIKSSNAALGAGIALVPEDRRREGLILQHSIKRNANLSILSRLARFGLINERRARESTKELVGRLRVKTPSIDVPVHNLSGGNQQKVVIAKSLAAEPDILLLDEPTAGVDVGSKAEIIELVRGLAAEGKGIVVISSELPELLALSDRVVVLHDGVVDEIVSKADIAADFPPDTTPEDAIHLAERYLQRAIQPQSHEGTVSR
jgi:ribose transport system ATP-binding protein